MTAVGHASRGAALAAWVLVTPAAQAHGERLPGSPWIEGAKSLLQDPSCLLLLLALALLLAQHDALARRRAGPVVVGSLAAGAVAAALGAGADLTLPLLAMTILAGGWVAWARGSPQATPESAAAAPTQGPWPDIARAALLAVGILGVMLMQAPAETASASERLGWIAGVVLAAALLSGNTLGLVLALLGRRPGLVRRMLLRVAGSWIATAAILVLVLEISRRG